MTCLACSTTSFSTQPPETDPTNSPSSAMAIFAPGRRGAEPYACTTVATATFLPASRQRSISGSNSFISPVVYRWRLEGKVLSERLEARQIVGARKQVHVRQRCAHPSRKRPVVLVAE